MDGKKVYSTGSMENTAFADALIGALQKQGGDGKPGPVPLPLPPKTTETEKPVEVVPAITVVLPDVKEIAAEKVVIPTLKDAEIKIVEEVGTAKQWAEEAGAEVARIDVNLERINAEIFKVERRIKNEPDVRLSATLRELRSQLEEAKSKEVARRARLLDAGGEDLKAHVQFVRLLEEIRTTDSSNIGEVREIFGRVHQLGLRKIVSKDELEKLQKGLFQNHQGPIFFEGQISVPVSATGGQKGLEAELRKLTDAAKLSKAASIRMRGDANLSDFETGRAGLYYFFSPKRIEKAHVSPAGVEVPERKFYEGHALVEIKDINKGKFTFEGGKKIPRKPFVVVIAKDAIGSLAWMASDRWIPHFWVRENKIISKEKLEQEEFDRSLRMIRTLRALYAVWHKGLNPEAAKPKEKTEGSAYTTPEADMTGVVIETKPSAKPEAEPKPKTTKKSKKAGKAE